MARWGRSVDRGAPTIDFDNLPAVTNPVSRRATVPVTDWRPENLAATLFLRNKRGLAASYIPLSAIFAA